MLRRTSRRRRVTKESLDDRRRRRGRLELGLRRDGLLGIVADEDDRQHEIRLDRSAILRKNSCSSTGPYPCTPALMTR